MDKKAVLALGIIAVILTMLFVVCFPLNCKRCSEGFQTMVKTSCPSGTNSFYDRRGDLLCCRGTVNGNRCEGRIECSFSGNTEYPICGSTKRRKYIGQINPFIAQIMAVDFVNKFSLVLRLMNNMKTTLGSLPQTVISTEDFNAYNSLIEEETLWYNDNMDSDSITYQEECMYIIQRLTTLFQGKPLMKNPGIVQKQIQKQMCQML
jgi:hypothetical protein